MFRVDSQCRHQLRILDPSRIAVPIFTARVSLYTIFVLVLNTHTVSQVGKYSSGVTSRNASRSGLGYSDRTKTGARWNLWN